jgi:hypothetical protein
MIKYRDATPETAESKTVLVAEPGILLRQLSDSGLLKRDRNYEEFLAHFAGSIAGKSISPEGFVGAWGDSLYETASKPFMERVHAGAADELDLLTSQATYEELDWELDKVARLVIPGIAKDAIACASRSSRILRSPRGLTNNL